MMPIWVRDREREGGKRRRLVNDLDLKYWIRLDDLMYAR